MKKLFSLTFVFALFFLPQLSSAIDVPYLTGRVTDNAQILSAETRQAITEMLKAHEDKTGNQVAVLTVPTLAGEGIEEYALTVFNEWKLGQKGKDNGVLIVVVPNDRRMRIEVGYGLEATLTDGKAGSIIRNIMTPRFKQGDYSTGIEEGVKAVIAVLEGGTLPQTETQEENKYSLGLNIEGPDLSIMERILFGAFIFGIIGLFTVIGVLTPGFGWFLYFFLIPFWAMFPIIVLGTKGAFYLLLVYLVGFPLAKIILKNTDWYQKAQKDLRTKGKANIGGFVLTSGGSGGSWTSGSSGGGFSGVGGSSGGGGASGSW
ncbi:MAG TPA: YgcG family protein [Smithellaceae bacterium]|nr:YgcG family protein [Smithellaceae bacterium]HRS89065.1 YgcG family protein [Smithellaceae bacterium]HRV25063.1 YgcG family protein [Smithellaceae bacterium]